MAQPLQPWNTIPQAKLDINHLFNDFRLLEKQNKTYSYSEGITDGTKNSLQVQVTNV